MKRYINPDKATWSELLARPDANFDTIQTSVNTILEGVKTRGNAALREYTERFDGAKLDTFQVSTVEFEVAKSAINTQLVEALEVAKANIWKFHAAQKKTDYSKIETTRGVQCWQKVVPIQRVGLYIPGGTAPLLSTILMLGIPAKIAGCQEIVICTPPQKDGKINAGILYTAQLLGISKVYKVGGAQAIAAMAYGNTEIPKVDKIFGPGNQYVSLAKALVAQAGTAIDMIAGPSEVLVWGDAQANPNFVAADLLSQAEHGEDSQVVLVTENAAWADKVEAAIEDQVVVLPRQTIARKALENSVTIVLEKEQDAIDLINLYAPEHLIISTENYQQQAEQIYNAGSIFLGAYAPESVGDYASGTNHTLPTSGWAKSSSGLNLDAFMKKITFQELSKEGLQNIASAVKSMAKAEQLQAHYQAVQVRLDVLNPQK
ncbi:MAG: histidinol dehydrogenase [Saprospiraceae bacterium]|nr:histidinol dehydrogenase [Saprospiraceae bacterium]